MAELTALPKSVVETVLGRDLTEDEKVFVTSLEDAGLMDAPVAEPEPTEAELIMAAPDCEHIVVKPKEDNPFGYARGHTYRSKSLGKEVALTYDWADRVRDGEVVGEDAVVEHVEVRDVKIELPVKLEVPVEVRR